MLGLEQSVCGDLKREVRWCGVFECSSRLRPALPRASEAYPSVARQSSGLVYGVYGAV